MRALAQRMPGIAAPARAGAEARPYPFVLRVLFVYWVLVVTEVDWFVLVKTGVPVNRVTTLFTLGIAIVALAQGATKAIYWPMFLFFLMHVGASVFAENAGMARAPMKVILQMVVLFAGTSVFVNSPRKATTLLKLYLLAFAWWEFQGIPSGLVKWHPLMNNEDSFGPLMDMTMAFSFFFALAAPSPRWKWLARVMFVLSILGVVATRARGASLAAVVILLYCAFRSPQRAKALGSLALMAIVLVPVAGRMFDLDAYIERLKTTAGGDPVRTELWDIAVTELKLSPLVGVGVSNFGVVGARITPYNPDSPGITDPAKLYSRAVHNAPMEIIAEEGLIGITLWTIMSVAFFFWTARLRTREAAAIWAARGGGELNLRWIAIGLEGAMLGFQLTSIFYNQIYIHWFWSLLTIAFVLAALTRAPVPRRTARAPVLPLPGAR